MSTFHPTPFGITLWKCRYYDTSYILLTLFRKFHILFCMLLLVLLKDICSTYSIPLFIRFYIDLLLSHSVDYGVMLLLMISIPVVTVRLLLMMLRFHALRYGSTIPVVVVDSPTLLEVPDSLYCWPTCWILRWRCLTWRYLTHITLITGDLPVPTFVYYTFHIPHTIYLRTIRSAYVSLLLDDCRFTRTFPVYVVDIRLLMKGILIVPHSYSLVTTFTIVVLLTFPFIYGRWHFVVTDNFWFVVTYTIYCLRFTFCGNLIPFDLLLRFPTGRYLRCVTFPVTLRCLLVLLRPCSCWLRRCVPAWRYHYRFTDLELHYYIWFVRFIPLLLYAFHHCWCTSLRFVIVTFISYIRDVVDLHLVLLLPRTVISFVDVVYSDVGDLLLLRIHFVVLLSLHPLRSYLHYH